MKNQNNHGWQTLLLATIAAVFLSGAFNSIFAHGKINNFSMLDYFSSTENSDLPFGSASAKFDFTNIQTHDSFAAGFTAAGDYPKPDFSEIEKWYEVVKYEYGDFEGGDNTLYFTLKPKNDNRPGFYVYFYDKDGAKVQGPNAALCWECAPNDAIDTVQKYHALAPTETNMKKVASVKIERWKN